MKNRRAFLLATFFTNVFWLTLPAADALGGKFSDARVTRYFQRAGLLSEAEQAPPVIGGNANKISVLTEWNSRFERVLELERLLSYRKRHHIPTFPAASRAVKKAGDEVRSLGRGFLLEKNPEYGVDEVLVNLDELLDRAEGQLDRHWPDGRPLRCGAGWDGFGRFGLGNNDAPLIGEEATSWNSLTQSRSASKLVVTVPGAAIRNQQRGLVDWTGGRREFILADGKGRDIHWLQWRNLQTPGILVETNSPRLAVSRGIVGQSRPDRILVPRRDRLVSQIYRPDGKIDLAGDEPWLLLCWEREAGNPPALLVFETLPTSFSWQENALQITFAETAGRFGVGSYAGTEAWDPEISRGWSSPSRSILEKCRKLATMFRFYAVENAEFFCLDEKRSEVEVTSCSLHLKNGRQRGFRQRSLVSIPPVLPLAKDCGLPVRISRFAQDLSVAGNYGPCFVVPGTESVYTLPVPALSNRLAPVPAEKRYSIDIRPNALNPKTACRLFLCWALLDEQSQALFLDRCRPMLEERLEANERQGWEIDEASGVLFWRGTDDSFEMLEALVRYSRFSGDWTFAQAYLPLIKNLLKGYMQRSDWALFSPVSLAGKPGTGTASTPSALQAALAIRQLAEQLEEQALLDRACYFSARLYAAWMAGVSRGIRDDATFADCVHRVAGNPPSPVVFCLFRDAMAGTLHDYLAKGVVGRYPKWMQHPDREAVGDFVVLREMFAITDSASDIKVLSTLTEEANNLGMLGALANRLGRRAPAKLLHWSPAAIGEFTFVPGKVTLVVRGACHLEFETERNPVGILDNGIPAKMFSNFYLEKKKRFFLKIGEGTHRITLDFNAPATKDIPRKDSKPTVETPN